ncbi:IclR family transcriptional regulator [Thalassoglobus sp.]|uniref:IclR family transcriptional regulator n=1 Tax=Thalassoglobus sp. TaxID=2795869 RepID=UPI003AA8948F
MSQPVGTLVKAMDVLDLLGEAAPIGVNEISRKLGMDKSTVSRLLSTLRSRDYVRLSPDQTGYDIGLRIFELGKSMQERMPVRETLIPHVDALAEKTGETVFALHYSKGLVAYLYDCVSSQDIRLGERTGLRVAPWNHPAGKTILAFRGRDEVMDKFASRRRSSRAGLPTIKEFLKEMDRISHQGYDEQRDEEKCLISVPILNETGNVNAALMVGGPIFRMDQKRTQPLVSLLKKHAAEVSRSLGWMKQKKSDRLAGVLQADSST